MALEEPGEGAGEGREGERREGEGRGSQTGLAGMLFPLMFFHRSQSSQELLGAFGGWAPGPQQDRNTRLVFPAVSFRNDPPTEGWGLKLSDSQSKRPPARCPRHTFLTPPTEGPGFSDFPLGAPSGGHGGSAWCSLFQDRTFQSF